MLELNVVTAIPIGAFAAFVWAGVLLQRLLRRPRADRLSPNQKLVVCATAAIALVPALIAGFVFASFLSRITVVPGVWSHLVLALTMVFGLAVIGAAIPVAAGWAVAMKLIGGTGAAASWGKQRALSKIKRVSCADLSAYPVADQLLVHIKTGTDTL